MGAIATQTDYGEWLRRKREALGLSRRKLADFANISPSSLSKYEQGLALPNEFIRAKVDNAFNELTEDVNYPIPKEE